MQNQLWLMGATSMIGSPELGGAVSKAVGGLAARLGGEAVGRIVGGIVEAIEALLRKVLTAFAELFRWTAKPVQYAISEMRQHVREILAKSAPGSGSVSSSTSGAWGPPHPAGIQDPQLRSVAEQLYRPGASIGNGGTGDAIRAGFGHEVKGAERIIQLGKWLDAHPRATAGDIHAAQSMLQDLISAMCGERYPGR